MDRNLRQFTQDKLDFLQTLYENIENPCGYSGKNKIFKLVRKKGEKIFP